MSMKRMNYFKGEFLNEVDFEDEQKYHINMLREHNENLHNEGIAAGLEVPEKFEDGTDVIGGTDIFIKMGMAIDDLGRQIVLTEHKRINASTIIPSGSTKTVFYLIIYYYEEPTDTREDNPGKLENTRINEEPLITFVESLLSNDIRKPQILAKVTLDSNKKITNIDPTVRKYASSRIADKSITNVQIADRSITAVQIDSGAVGRGHLNSDIFNGLLSSPDGTIGVQPDIPNRVIKLTSQVATGIVEFSGFTPSVQNVSGYIDPGFGAGATSVILGMDETDTSNKQVFIGDSEAAMFFNLPDILLGALVDTQTGKFRIGMSVKGAASAPIRVRWWAFKPGLDKGVVVVVSVSVDPLNTGLRPGNKQQFSAIVTGTNNKAVRWSVEEIDGGSITNTGLYTAPITPGIYHVKATSLADATKSGTSEAVITEEIAVSISPVTASMFAGHEQQFTAIVTGTSSPNVTWSTNGGRIDTSGLYTAPATAGTYKVVAASKANPTKTAEAIVEVKEDVAITISPADVNLFTGGQQSFKATVTGSANTGVLWSVKEGATGGTIDGTGLYTAPSGIVISEPVPTRIIPTLTPTPISTITATPIMPTPAPTPIMPVRTAIPTPTPGVIGTYHVVATSKADPTKKAEASVTVTLVSVSIDPGNVSILAGKTQQFTATVMGVSNTGVVWSVQEGAAGGKINSAGLYTSPATPGTYHIIATSVADNTKFDTATVTVTPAISVSINPVSPTVTVNQGIQFNAVVTGTTNTAVTWGVQEVGGGSINAAGLYIAPGTPGTYHVIVSSNVDPTKSARETVTVTPAISVSINPVSSTVTVNQGIQFNAVVTGTTNTAVTWSVQEAGGGSINTTGLYIAPGTPGTYHVIARSAADNTKVASATITVTPAISVSVNPGFPTVNVNKGIQFNAVVTGTTNTAVTWSVQESGGGSINTTGLYIAPGTQGTYHIIATSAADNTRVAIATVTVTQLISVSVNPISTTVTVNKGIQFNAVVTGTTNTAVTWSVQESGGGSINTTGLYIAPGTQGTYHIIATSAADNTKVAIATVTVTPAISVSVDPASATVNVNQGLQFNAVVTGTTNTAVRWGVQETGGGSINTTGLYVAPGTPGTYHVIATSMADPTKSATATVTVTAVKAAIEKLTIEKLKDTDKITKEIEKIVKEVDRVITPIMNPGPITDGGFTFDGTASGRAFIRAEERPDVGNITSPK